MNSQMIFLTGSKQSGKTERLLEITAKAEKKGLRVAGIACPGLWENDRRSGFDLRELDTGNKYPLSRRVRGFHPIPYMFDAQGLEKGGRALSISRCREADLVAVDEVGWLELGGEGWAHCLGPLLRLERPVHLWVVRTSLVKQVQAHFGVQASVFTMQDSAMDYARLFKEIAGGRRNNNG